MIKVLNTRNNMIGLAMKEDDNYNVIFADGSQKDVKAASFERHYKVLDENATANDFSAPEGSGAIGKEEAEAAKAAKEASKAEGKKANEGKSEEELAAEKAAKEAAKAEAKAKRDQEKADAKAKKDADKEARKAEKEAEKAAKAAERAAKKQAEEAPFEPFPFTFEGSVATKTSKVDAATAHTFTHGEFKLTLTVENDSKGISLVKRGCHVQKLVTTTEEGKEPVTEFKTVDKCTSISKALTQMEIAEADVLRAKKTIAVMIKGEASDEQASANQEVAAGSEA